MFDSIIGRSITYFERKIKNLCSCRLVLACYNRINWTGKTVWLNPLIFRIVVHPKVSFFGCFLYNLLLILLYDCDIMRASLQRCGFGAFKSLYQVGAKAS